MKNILFRYLLVVFIIAGCSSDTIKGSYFTFTDKQWKRFETAEIEFGISKPGIFYNMWLELDYDTSLAPEILPVTVIMYTPSGEVRSRTLRLKLKEQNENNRDGKLRVMLRKDFAFSEKGSCSFEFENRSQNIETPGMVRIGIVLEKRK